MRALILNLLMLVSVNWLSMVNASKENISESPVPNALTFSRCFHGVSGGFSVGACKKIDGEYVGGTVDNLLQTSVFFDSNGAVISEETYKSGSIGKIPLDPLRVAGIKAVMKGVVKLCN